MKLSLEEIFFHSYFAPAPPPCKKEEVQLLAQEIALGTGYSFYDVYFPNDSVGFPCDGSKYAIGIFLKTQDGGNTWTIADSIIPKCAYSSFFFNEQEGLVVGYDSWAAYTNDSAKNFHHQYRYLFTH